MQVVTIHTIDSVKEVVSFGQGVREEKHLIGIYELPVGPCSVGPRSAGLQSWPTLNSGWASLYMVPRNADPRANLSIAARCITHTLPALCRGGAICSVTGQGGVLWQNNKARRKTFF